MYAPRIGAAVLVVVSLLLMACGSGSTAGTSTSPSPTPASGQAPEPTPIQSPRTLTFNLIGCMRGASVATPCFPTWAGNPVHGSVRVDINSYGYTVTVIVRGLAPNSGHEINTHDGTCETTGTDLGGPDQGRHATADAKGTLSSITTWPDVYSVPLRGRIMSVHGNDETGSMIHVACANMTG
jgi:hypothetical protein